MTTISTHVLDTATGRPAVGLPVALERVAASATEAPGTGATPIASAQTGADGRVPLLAASIEPGVHRLRFDTGSWFAANEREGLWPEVVVTFTVDAGEEHYHVPLLLSPFGYSTYRGT